MLKRHPMLLAVLCLLLFCSGRVMSADDADDQAVEVKIADPYIELHTGPGRGYPVFYVVDRGELIELLKRKTDWFKVRYFIDGKDPGEKGTDQQEEKVIEGWVHRQQMEITLTPAGDPVEFIDVSLENFSARHWEAGMMGGYFNDIPVMTVFGGYSPVPTLSFELSYSEVVGEFTSSDIYGINVMAQPFPRWRVSPYFALGLGRIMTSTRTSLIQAPDTDDLMSHVGLGIKTYITRRFVFRLEYNDYVAFSSDDDNEEFKEWKAGFAFFF